MRATPREELRLALAVPRWAWRFYLRNLPVIAGLSLIPSVQRLVVVNWGERIPSGVAALSEVVVMAVRLVLLVVIWRLAAREARSRWALDREFVAAHWPSLVVQVGLLAAAALVFDFGMEQVVGGLLPETARQPYLAALLFVKNPTVIAFTFVWLAGTLRQLRRPSTSDEPLTTP